MAHIKQKGGYKGSSDSESKRLGVKLYGGQIAHAGNVIIRQRGTKFLPGENVKRGKDDTLYAAKDGTVTFKNKRKLSFDGTVRIAKQVSVK